MCALRLVTTGDLRLTDVDPPLPGPGQVVIRIKAADICGTDRHLYKEEFPCTTPVTLGQEFSGIVTGRGAGVDLPLGTRIVYDPNCPCKACPECRTGRVNLCRTNRVIGIHDDGGFANFARPPRRYPARNPQPA